MEEAVRDKTVGSSTDDNVRRVIDAFLSRLTEQEKACLRSVRRLDQPRQIAKALNIDRQRVRLCILSASLKLGNPEPFESSIFLEELESWDKGGREGAASRENSWITPALFGFLNEEDRRNTILRLPKSQKLRDELSTLQGNVEKARQFGYHYSYDVDGEFVGQPFSEEDTRKSVEDRLALIDKFVEENPGASASEFVRNLFPELSGVKPKEPELPTAAPALWSADRLPDESPSGFTKRVYDQWIGKGLTRPDIRRLDQPLYQALATWERRHPEDKVDLPTKKEVNDAWVQRVMSDPSESRDAQQISRRIDALRRRPKGK